MITIILDEQSYNYRDERAAMRRFIPLLKKASDGQRVLMTTLTKARHTIWDNPGMAILVGDRATKAFKFGSVMNYRGSIIKKGYLKFAPVVSPLRLIKRTVEGGRYPEWMHRIFIADLQRIAKESQYSDTLAIPVEAKINPTTQEVLDYLDILKEVNNFAFDIETSPATVTHISFSHEIGQGFCIPFIQRKGLENYFSPEDEYLIWHIIKELLESPKKVKIAQNGTFDCTYLMRKLGIQTQHIFDTMVAQNILDISLSHTR